MTAAKNFQTLDLSRRGLLRGAALAAGGGVLFTSAVSAAPAKLSQKVAAYQPTPKGKQRCDNCIQWLPPASCKVVEGPISPAGWCNLYAPKA
ncbi:MAG TPA: hypothetical protein VII63_03435 [Caulobacteraceae bacterium]